MSTNEKHTAIIKHFTAQGYEVIRWKNGYWLSRDGQRSFITSAQAAIAAGITPKTRRPKVLLPWGDYATIAMMNRR
jgi:hypothetical protein